MANDQTDKFLGSGITFPLKIINGKVAVDKGKVLVEASLRDILAWVLGTKFFLGEYGSKIEYLLQEPDNNVSSALLRFYTADLISKWEKRVDSSKVRIKIIKREPGVMTIKLDYQLTNTQITGSFIYPYYSQLIY